MLLTCTLCQSSHDYKAILEMPVMCLTCGRGFIPTEGYDPAVAAKEMWPRAKPRPRRASVIPDAAPDNRKRCPSGHLWYELEGLSKCTDPKCPAHPLARAMEPTPAPPPLTPAPVPIPVPTTPRARTIRPAQKGATRERVQYLALDEMEVAAIDRLQALVSTGRDYPDRNRDILLIGIAERLERIENMLMNVGTVAISIPAPTLDLRDPRNIKDDE